MYQILCILFILVCQCIIVRCILSMHMCRSMGVKDRNKHEWLFLQAVLVFLFSFFSFCFLFFVWLNLSLLLRTYWLAFVGWLVRLNGLSPPYLHCIHNHIPHTSVPGSLFGYLEYHFISSCFHPKQFANLTIFLAFITAQFKNK